MFVLGVDPGLTRCGYGLVRSDSHSSEQFTAVRAGTIETNRSLSIPERLAELSSQFTVLLDETKPHAVSIERIFFQRNVKTAISVAQASGVLMALAAARGIEIREFTAQQIKLSVSGYGAASKSQVQAMVAELLQLAAIPEPPDAADALGAAIAYFLTSRIETRYQHGVVT